MNTNSSKYPNEVKNDPVHFLDVQENKKLLKSLLCDPAQDSFVEFSNSDNKANRFDIEEDICKETGKCGYVFTEEDFISAIEEKHEQAAAFTKDQCTLYQENPLEEANQYSTFISIPKYDFYNNPFTSSYIVPTTIASKNLYDVYSIRRDFPILEEKINGNKLVWLDNAATTQKPRQVIERVKYFYEHENSNVHRAAHTLAARTTQAYEEARNKAAAFINATSSNEIIFTRGATEAINLIAQTYGTQILSDGDEVIVTLLEHHANIVPWQIICKNAKAKLLSVPVNNNGEIVLSEYEKLLSSRTKIVALTHISNALGTVLPIEEMIQAAHRHGAKVLIDGAQAVAHKKVDVKALDCDFYVFSGHKVYAPMGIGVLYGKYELLNSMEPYQSGGNMISNVTFENTEYKAPPHRFEAGTGSIADAIGLGAAIQYISGIGLDYICQYEHYLLEYAREALLALPGITIYGNANERASILSFKVNGFSSEEIGRLLDREGIAVRAGHHCSQPILRRLGISDTIRASFALYNTVQDIDYLASALATISRTFF